MAQLLSEADKIQKVTKTELNASAPDLLCSLVVPPR